MAVRRPRRADEQSQGAVVVTTTVDRPANLHAGSHTIAAACPAGA